MTFHLSPSAAASNPSSQTPPPSHSCILRKRSRRSSSAQSTIFVCAVDDRRLRSRRRIGWGSCPPNRGHKLLKKGRLFEKELEIVSATIDFAALAYRRRAETSLNEMGGESLGSCPLSVPDGVKLCGKDEESRITIGSNGHSRKMKWQTWDTIFRNDSTK